MNPKFTKLLVKSEKFIKKHSPEILISIGLTGMVTSIFLGIKATPKAMILINERKKELDTNKLTKFETIKTVWKPYLPTLGLTISSIACIVCASRTNYKRNAALATAYSISERTLTKYREKVIETIGENKEKKIRDNLAQDQVNKKPVSSQIIVSSKGNTLCMDAMSGRYFKSDMDTIKKAINKINRDMVYDHYVSLNQLYFEIGIEGVKNGELIGWNLDNGMIEPSFSTCLAENDEPCIVIDFMIPPKYDFDKFM